MSNQRRPGRPATGRTTRNLTVRLHLEDYQLVSAEASRSGQSISQFIREVILNMVRHRTP